MYFQNIFQRNEFSELQALNENILKLFLIARACKDKLSRYIYKHVSVNS